MGFWGSIKKAAKKVAKGVKKAAKAVGDTANKVANNVQDFISDVGNTIGNAVNIFGNALADMITEIGIRLSRTFLGRTWLTKIIKAIATWIGDIIRQIFNIVALVLRGVFNIIGAALGGGIKIVFGFFTLNFRLLFRGFWDIFSSILGFVAMFALEFLALVGIITTTQVGNRGLTKKEIFMLKEIFKNSLEYNVIRVQQGRAGLLWFFGATEGLRTRPFALGNTIYFKRMKIEDEILIHEVVHVWQYQKLGILYMGDAITAMTSRVPDQYNWVREIDVRNRKDWQKFNREAQAEFFEDLWLKGRNIQISTNTTSNKPGDFFRADGVTTIPVFIFTDNNSNPPVLNRDFTPEAEESTRIVRSEDIVSGWRPI